MASNVEDQGHADGDIDVVLCGLLLVDGHWKHDVLQPRLQMGGHFHGACEESTTKNISQNARTHARTYTDTHTPSSADVVDDRTGARKNKRTVQRRPPSHLHNSCEVYTCSATAALDTSFLWCPSPLRAQDLPRKTHKTACTGRGDDRESCTPSLP